MSDEILNPDIYLNYLQPASAGEYEAARNVYLATLGALLWDVLSSLPEDWRLIRTSKPTPVLFAYFSARICAVVVALLSVLVKTGPITHCGVLALNVRVFWVVATTSSSYLILKRVHAVFHQERIVCRIFTFFWLAAFGASLVVLLDPLKDYTEIANTKHCTVRQMKNTHVPRDFKAKELEGFFRGDALPRLSRAVLHGVDRRYYLITTAFNVARPFLGLLPTWPSGVKNDGFDGSLNGTH
ncbi:hypothetical protein BU15DRAFT_73445 [Melanogaster broomeanus]|nr:hypothetical protein BU15DRAFT_73445 [Melanogaster broomeanus]